MELTSLDMQTNERVPGAEASGDDENSASVGPAAGFDSGSTSSAENLPVLSDSKVRRCYVAHTVESTFLY